MSPDDLAGLHPELFHVTEPGANVTIRQYGLLSSERLLDLLNIEPAQRARFTQKRRPEAVELEHDASGRFVLNDNLPLTEKALAGCLDDGLQPSDWLKILNGKVFFWPSRATLDRLLNARLNRWRSREVLVLNALSLLQDNWDRVRVCPINSGSTIRKPARRGLSTFSRPSDYSYPEWRKLRGGYDRIVEITVDGGVEDISKHIIDVFQTEPVS